jgi:1,4-alpha-glucan branching enzyme
MNPVCVITGALLCTTALAQPIRQPAEFSPRETADGVLFQCLAPEAQHVYLAGNFNRWADNRDGRIQNPRYALQGPDERGVFSTVIPLPIGIHRYKFVADIGTNTFWFVPEYARQRDEDGNAFLEVDGIVGNDRVAVAARAPQFGPEGVTFEFFAPDAPIVFLAGDFNQWAGQPGGRIHDLRFAMRGPDDHGIWRAVIPLRSGRYRYQYVMDGNTWVPDPLARETTPDHKSIVVAP